MKTTLLLCLLLTTIASAQGAFEGNSKNLSTDYPTQYKSWYDALDAATAPTDISKPFNPAHTIIEGRYNNYRDSVEGKGAHPNSMLEVYGTIAGDTSYVQRCLPCHTSNSPELFHKYGEDGLFQGKFDKLAESINPIGCANCHNTETMELRVSQPFAISAMKKIGKDPEKLSQHELRSYVCIQCHFEYDVVVKNGAETIQMDMAVNKSMDELSDYYDNKADVAFTHPISKAPLIRTMDYIQETRFILNGPHYKHGTACADCHMPQVTKKGEIYTTHDTVRGSKNIAASCLPCHEDSNVKELQQEVDIRIAEYRGTNFTKLENSLVQTHILVGEALKAGATEKDLKNIYYNIRGAQWRWGYLIGLKGSTFHNVFDSQKMLATGLAKISDAEVETILLLSKLGVKDIKVVENLTLQQAAQLLGLKYPPEKSKVDNTYLKAILKATLDKGALNSDIYNYEAKKLF